MMTQSSLINDARKRYHERLVSQGVLTIDNAGLASNADKSNITILSKTVFLTMKKLAISKAIMLLLIVPN